MNRFKLTLIAIIFSINCFAQNNLISLHALVGDTINKSEKTKYMLFPEVSDPDFTYGYITRINNSFYLNYFDTNDSVTIKPIDPIEMNQYIDKLNKLSDYYSTLEKKDTTQNSKKVILDLNGVQTNYVKEEIIGEDSKKRIKGEVKQYIRLKDDAERLQIQKKTNDIMWNNGRVEFPVIKRRKK